MRDAVIAFVASIAVSNACMAADCDYSKSPPDDCVARGYPDARIPPPDIWKDLEKQLRHAQNIATESDIAFQKAADARNFVEEKCSGHLRHIRRLLPQCQNAQAVFAQRSAEAHSREVEANYALNKVLAETSAAYNLWPAGGVSGQGGGEASGGLEPPLQ